MQTNQPEVTWRQFAGIVSICTASGTIVGAASYLGVHVPRTPWVGLPIVLLAACVVALPFALIAGVFAALVLIFFTKFGPSAPSRARKAFAGALAGAVIGALHPFVLLLFVVAHWTLATPAGPLWFAAVTAASGAVAGALVVVAYGDSVRCRVV